MELPSLVTFSSANGHLGFPKFWGIVSNVAVDLSKYVQIFSYFLCAFRTGVAGYVIYSSEKLTTRLFVNSRLLFFFSPKTSFHIAGADLELLIFSLPPKRWD